MPVQSKLPKPWRLKIAAVVLMLVPTLLQAQGAVCDFDIHDDEGRFVWGSTVHLTGRAGSGTEQGNFVITNGNNPSQDADDDGYSGTCNFDNLYISQRTTLSNVANTAFAIPPENIVVTALPRSLPLGTLARVQVSVVLPVGTVAGRYVGFIVVEDAVLQPGSQPGTNETLRRDFINIEVTVLEDRDISLLHPDTAGPLDSLVLRGRAGQRTSGVLRVANTGNAPVSDIRLSASDLRSESAVGLVIPSSNVSFAPVSFSGLSLSDTVRVTVSVQIPRGILGGRYRGTITVQGSDAAASTIPLIVIVTSSRGILFANNPVRGSDGVAQLAFNGDPGTAWKLGIFDMTGRQVYQTNGTVFGGVGGTPGNPTSGADFAQSVIWSLTNGLGEPVASGMYLVVVESIVAGQRTLARDKLMVIR